jgi:two-component system sensor histidine kinase UhpB
MVYHYLASITQMSISSKYISLFIILLWCSYPAHAQTPWADSVKKILPTQKEDTSKITTLLKLSGAYRFSYPDSSLVYAQKSLLLAEKIHSAERIFWSIASINQSLYVLGNYVLELDYAFKALPIAKKINSPFTMGYSSGMISDSYFNLGEYNMALKYWREVVKITEQKLPDERAAVYGNSSHIFECMHQYDSALIYAKKSYELIKYREDKFLKSGVFTALGAAFAGKARYDSALFFYRMSLPFSDESRMDVNKVDAYNGIAKLYKETSHFDSAIWYAKKALGEKLIKNYPAGFLKATNFLAAMYESVHNSDSTLKYLHMAINARDSLFNREKTYAFQNIVFKDQEKQKEVEAARLRLQAEYKSFFLIVFLIIMFTVAAFIIRNRRRKQLQNMRNNIADDLHDDIGSTLSSISIMSELAKTNSKEIPSLLASIGESTNTIQENMSDIVWAIKSTNDRFENVIQRMNQFASEMLDAKNIELDFTSDESLYASRLTMQQRKNFYLFFKEVINNAAKYADAKKVSVWIAQKDHHVEMNIRDNGKGFDTAKIYNGNGMNTLKKRAAELNADFKIVSGVSEGTAVQLKFKIT